MLANFLCSISLSLSLSCDGFNYFAPFEPIEGSSGCDRKNSIKSKTQVSTPLPIPRIVLDPRPSFFFKCKKKIENKNNVHDPFSAKFSFPSLLSLSLALVIFCQLRRLEFAICADLSQGCPLWGALISWRQQQDEEGAEDTTRKGCLLWQSIA